MSDHLDRAAEALWAATCPDGIRAAWRGDCWAMAQALDAAGLLVSPERDAAVAAKALRAARRYLVRVHPNGLTRKATVIADMDELIARIEAGESDE